MDGVPVGELASLGSAACWSVSALLFAHLTTQAGPMELNFAKCAIATVLLALTRLALSGAAWPPDLGAASSAWLAASGIAGLTLGDTMYFAALARIGPRRSLLLAALAPPITAVISWPALGEAITPGMLVGMAVTLGGVVWVVWERSAVPGAGSAGSTSRTTATDPVGVLAGVGAAACTAVGNVLTKVGGEGLSSLDQSIVRLAAGAAGLALVVAWGRAARPSLQKLSTPRTLAVLVGATFVGTYTGIWLQVTGLTYAPAAVATTLSSTSPVFVLPLAAIFLGERITMRAVLGAFVAVLGVALMVVL